MARRRPGYQPHQQALAQVIAGQVFIRHSDAPFCPGLTELGQHRTDDVLGDLFGRIKRQHFAHQLVGPAQIMLVQRLGQLGVTGRGGRARRHRLGCFEGRLCRQAPFLVHFMHCDYRLAGRNALVDLRLDAA